MTDIAVRETPATDATVRLAAAGDELAFARLVAQHHAAMARVAYVIVGDVETTRDAMQAAWLTAWRRLRSLRRPESVRPWLVAIAANEARQAVRRRRRQAWVVDISDDIEMSRGSDPSDRIATVDLERALRGVGPDDRALLALRFVAGLDSTEIARHLGLSSSGARSRLARLLARLRASLEPTDGAAR